MIFLKKITIPAITSSSHFLNSEQQRFIHRSRKTPIFSLRIRPTKPNLWSALTYRSETFTDIFSFAVQHKLFGGCGRFQVHE